MLVDLVCVKECFVDVEGIGKHRHCVLGQRFYEIDVEGDEVWLKFFNAYEPEERDKAPKPIKRILIEDIGVADKDAEKKEDPPTSQEVGAGPAMSIENITNKFSDEEMINMLKADGLKLASSKWNKETLAKHVQKRQLYVGRA